MFTQYKIPSFAQKISDMPDMPNLAPAELKARFDACPEQLRVALNGVCDDASALETKVEGIVAQTYGGTIHETMLDTPLAGKINAKADQTAVDSSLQAVTDSLTVEAQTRENAVSAEAAARASAVAAEATARTCADNNLQSQINSKCRMASGTYTGDGNASKTVSTGFTPSAVWVIEKGTGTTNQNYGLAVTDHPATFGSAGTIVEIVSGGFKVFYESTSYGAHTNASGYCYPYIAFA